MAQPSETRRAAFADAPRLCGSRVSFAPCRKSATRSSRAGSAFAEQSRGVNNLILSQCVFPASSGRARPPRGGNPANLPLLGRSKLVKQGDCVIFRLRRPLRTRRQIVVRRHYNNFAGLWQGNSPTEPQL